MQPQRRQRNDDIPVVLIKRADEGGVDAGWHGLAGGLSLPAGRLPGHEIGPVGELLAFGGLGMGPDEGFEEELALERDGLCDSSDNGVGADLDGLGVDLAAGAGADDDDARRGHCGEVVSSRKGSRDGAGAGAGRETEWRWDGD